MTQSAYPLSWPLGIPRVQPGSRQQASFKTALNAALTNVTNSLRRFGDATRKPISNIVISTNYTLGDQKPSDPGVAVWFVWDGSERCIAVDRYVKLEFNLQAIHHILEARITEARHGGLQIVRQTFTGFIALPAPEMFAGRTPAQILGIDGLPFTRDDVIAAHRDLAKKAHPDSGGSGDDMAVLNAARNALLGGLA